MSNYKNTYSLTLSDERAYNNDFSIIVYSILQQIAEGKNKYSGIKLELGVSIWIQKFGRKDGKDKEKDRNKENMNRNRNQTCVLIFPSCHIFLDWEGLAARTLQQQLAHIGTRSWFQ